MWQGIVVVAVGRAMETKKTFGETQKKAEACRIIQLAATMSSGSIGGRFCNLWHAIDHNHAFAQAGSLKVGWNRPGNHQFATGLHQFGR